MHVLFVKFDYREDGWGPKRPKPLLSSILMVFEGNDVENGRIMCQTYRGHGEGRPETVPGLYTGLIEGFRSSGTRHPAGKNREKLKNRDFQKVRRQIMTISETRMKFCEESISDHPGGQK